MRGLHQSAREAWRLCGLRGWSSSSLRIGVLLALFFVFACASPGQGSKGKISKHRVATTEFTGRLLGHDGRPMPMAHVTIDDAVTQVDSDGGFRIAVPQDSLVRALFTGVDHGDHTAQLLFQSAAVQVEVRLGTYKRKEPMGEVSVVEIQFRDKGEITLGAVHPMLRTADGSYRATVAAKGEFAYEIRGLTAQLGRTMNGSARTRYRYDGNGNYCNVMKASGGAVIVEHDQRRAPPPGIATTLAFANPTSVTAQLAAIFDRANQFGSVASRLAAIAGEEEAGLRHARSIALFATLEGNETEDRAVLSALASSTLDAVPSASLLWRAAPTSLAPMLDFAGPDYRERGLELLRHLASDEGVDLAASLALRFLIRSASAGDEESLRRYFDFIRAELHGTMVAKLAPLFHPERKIRMGKFLPQFELPSADDDRVFSNRSFSGKVLLIDFWATWCPPCLDELPNLHQTYAELHESGFEILSINIDDKAGRSQAMRKRGAFPMPWSHVVVHRRDAGRLKRRFEVAGLPTMILVDGKGKILATDVFTRGTRLRARVRAALKSNKP